MAVTGHEFILTEPYRLDLTVSALRRVATNVVDVFTEEGEFFRALSDGERLAVVRVRQPAPDRLTLQVMSEAADDEATVTAMRSVLGIDRSVTRFRESSRRVPWLADLVDRFAGLRPPRFPSLWEAFVNAVLFQQVSLQSASAITRRLIVTLSDTVMVEERRLYVFPEVERFHDAPDAQLRAAGLSGNKLRTLREASEGIRSGEMSAIRLQTLSSPDAARELETIWGIGPWTAAVILLRGLGRLDVFPPNDSGVNANLRRLAGGLTEMPALLDGLGPERGLLYFYLLLGKLDREGRLGEPSVPWEGS